MIFLGRILQVDDRDEYYKTVIGVETGYTTDVYIIRISHNKIERRSAINDQVVFTGVEGRSVDKSIFALESIKFTEYSSCLECGFPMTSSICMIRHDKEAQKLDGDWIIFHKIEKNGYIKLFFQRNRLTFGTVAQPRDFITLSWLYNKFKDLKEGDKVIARGWRYKTRTSLSFIEKIAQNRYENIQVSVKNNSAFLQ